MSADQHLNAPLIKVTSIGTSFICSILKSTNGIIIANALMICIWIAGIVGMVVAYLEIHTYKDDPLSGSELFKTLYAACHLVISIILLFYIFVKSYCFLKPKTDSSTTDMTGGVNFRQAIMNGADGSFKIMLDFFLSVPINIRTDIENIMEKFENIKYDGTNYKTQVNLTVMLKLVLAHCPIIIFLIVLTSIVSMIKAYHKILCGSANSGVIEWYYRLVDIVMYAIFRIIGLLIILHPINLKLVNSASAAVTNFVNHVFNNNADAVTYAANYDAVAVAVKSADDTHSSSTTTYFSGLLGIFYFTALYLIIRFILLLYENMFSDTIVSVYKWDIRETDCNTNNYGQTTNWILDPDARQHVKSLQNDADKSKTKHANDVFSLIFNILVILFLSGISIMSVVLLAIHSHDKALLDKLLRVTNEIGYKTKNEEPK